MRTAAPRSLQEISENTLCKMANSSLYGCMKKLLKKKPKLKNSSRYQCDFKVAVLGASGVGKTSILNMALTHSFSESYVPTIESSWEMALPYDAVDISLQIFDVSGSGDFALTRSRKIAQADAFIIVFSLADKTSFEYIKKLKLRIEQIKKKEISALPVVVVGNKCDLNPREITRDDILKVCVNGMDSPYAECSAKDDVGLFSVFETLCDELGICDCIHEKVDQLQCQEAIRKTNKAALGKFKYSCR